MQSVHVETRFLSAQVREDTHFPRDVGVKNEIVGVEPDRLSEFVRALNEPLDIVAPWNPMKDEGCVVLDGLLKIDCAVDCLRSCRAEQFERFGLVLAAVPPCNFGSARHKQKTSEV